MATQGSHFWFMVIAMPGGNVGSYQGTITPRPGATRLDMFNQVREDVRRHAPATTAGAVTAFDVQPNQL